MNKLLIRKTRPRPTWSSTSIPWGAPGCYLGVADVQSAYWQSPAHPDHDVERTAFVTNLGKSTVVKGCCLGIAMRRGSHRCLIQRWGSYILYVPELLIYMGDLCVLTTTFENHREPSESVFMAPRAASLTLTPSKVAAFGPKSLKYFGPSTVTARTCFYIGKDRSM